VERERIHLATLGEKECFGEFALIDEGPRSASTIADTDVVLLRWERGDFQTTISRHPQVASGLLKTLTGKLRNDVSVQVGWKPDWSASGGSRI
jgi:CRP/FNR family transcriptional regulator